MMRDEYIAGVEAQRDALKLRLAIIMASNISKRVKNVRIRQVTQEAIALKNEIRAMLEHDRG